MPTYSHSQFITRRAQITSQPRKGTGNEGGAAFNAKIKAPTPNLHIDCKGSTMKNTTKVVDGYFVYTCPHCGMQSGNESINPKVNANPFSYLPNCSGCTAPKTPDWDLIEATHAALLESRK